MRAVVFAYSNVGDRCLRVLVAGGVDVALVVTHKDQPGETLWFQRVADTALELGLPLAYAEDLAPPALLQTVAQARPDAIFSFYYRSMLPTALLDLVPGRAFNMHGSLLPQFRGRAPTNWAVLQGATETGATLHEMVAKPDAGAIVDQSAVPILPDDTARQVFDKVTVAAEQVLWRTLPALLAGTQPRLPNDTAKGSYFAGRRPEDGRIDWLQPAAQVYNLVRAVAPPYPGAFTTVAGRRLVLAQARRLAAGQAGETGQGGPIGPIGPTGQSAQPGQAAGSANRKPGLHVVGDRIIGVCGDGGLLHINMLLDADAASGAGTALNAAALQQLLQDEPGNGSTDGTTA